MRSSKGIPPVSTAIDPMELKSILFNLGIWGAFIGVMVLTGNSSKNSISESATYTDGEPVEYAIPASDYDIPTVETESGEITDADEDAYAPDDPEMVTEVENTDVGYENPNTGYSSEYVLDVEYSSDGTVERITFDNGGWEDDFVSQVDNDDGTVTVIDEDGREFTVKAMDQE
jgi:hypothetical protein